MYKGSILTFSGLSFRVACFTNISRDHLDYHKTMKNYIEAKRLLFDSLDKKATAIINLDCQHGHEMIKGTKADVKSISMTRQEGVDYIGSLSKSSDHALVLTIDNCYTVKTKIFGEFNGHNLLMAYAIARNLGLGRDPNVDESHLKGLKTCPIKN